jgi:hypothetical protein
VTTTRTATETVTVAAPAQGNACTADDLTGTFQVLQGSAGAGNIVYTLKVTNASQSACTVGGVPSLAFLDASGNELPSHVAESNSGTDTVVTLQPGDSARSQVRFSPDVDPCDPGTAQTLHVAIGPGTLNVPIDPPTKLCGAGSLQPSAFTGAD